MLNSEPRTSNLEPRTSNVEQGFMHSVLVSSCLLGLATRYDGSANYSQAVADYLRRNGLIPIPICPEQLAGLPTPRPKCWFIRGAGAEVLKGLGQICDAQGNDVSHSFRHGAEQSLKLAELTGCRQAILKQRSPSCGSRNVYQNGKLVIGMGVTAALFAQQGMAVISEEEL
jgi:uncharacterized protein YbbK (DUF523 family)